VRGILRRQAKARVLLGEVTHIDVAQKRIEVKDNGSIGYDSLIVASGSRHSYFSHPEWEPIAPGLKTIEDATRIRHRVLMAFERAERTENLTDQIGHLTFVIVGGGPTGVEMAGAISELARHTLRRNFRRINPARARILLVEGADRVLPPYPPKLSAKAEQALQKLGVEVWTNALVTAIRPESVDIKRPDGIQTLPTTTVIWAAGVEASPLGKILADATGAPIDRAGRVSVGSDLTLPNHSEIFVIGDLALSKDASGKPHPGIAPVAMQQGHYVARTIHQRLLGESPGPFKYRDKGMLATIGRGAAVGVVFGVNVSGLIAWLAWLFIHLMYLVEFENRILVFLQWLWNYVTRNRAARLITGVPAEEF
jgi:NADH dehydrogenase